MYKKLNYFQIRLLLAVLSFLLGGGPSYSVTLDSSWQCDPEAVLLVPGPCLLLNLPLPLVLAIKERRGGGEKVEKNDKK